MTSQKKVFIYKLWNIKKNIKFAFIMGYNGSKDGKTRAFKSDKFPKRNFPKLIKGNSSLLLTLSDIESFSSFCYDLLDACKEVRNALIKKDVRILYCLIIVDLFLLFAFFFWRSNFCLIIGTILSFFLLANIWLLFLYTLLLVLLAVLLLN